jgi:hypothetical protein
MSGNAMHPPEVQAELRDQAQQMVMKQTLLAEAEGALRIGDERSALTIMRGFFGLPDTPDSSAVGYCYIAYAPEVNRYKIGFSMSDPTIRLAALQIGSPIVLELACVIPYCTIHDETALHARFSASRLHGEWFSETYELISFIQARKA